MTRWAPFADPAHAAAPRRSLTDDKGGAVMIEFLIAFLPVLTCFLTLLQLGLLYSVRLVVEHAAGVTARAAAVIIADKNDRYGEKGKKQPNKLKIGGNQRFDDIHRAAMIALAPYIIDGTIEGFSIGFPPPDKSTDNGGKQAKSGSTVKYAAMSYQNVSKVRVVVNVNANCKVGLGGPILCKYIGKSLGLPFITVSTPLGTLFPTIGMKAEATFPYQGARYDWQ